MRLYEKGLRDHILRAYPTTTIYEARLALPSEALKEDSKDGWRSATPAELLKWYSETPHAESPEICLIVAYGQIFKHDSDSDLDRIAAIFPSITGKYVGAIGTGFISVRWAETTRFLEVRDRLPAPIEQRITSKAA